MLYNVDIQYVYSLCVSGAFLLFSQKKIAKLKQTESDVHIRDAVIMQVFMHNEVKILKKSVSLGATLFFKPFSDLG